MKLALINPPSPFLINQRVFPNIGFVRLATVLENEGHNITFFDLAGEEKYLDKIKKIAFDYDFYLFSSTTPQFPYVYKLVTTLKKLNKNARTILGGAHACAMASLKSRGIKDKNLKTLKIFDTIFEGEGEDTTNLFKPGWQKGKIIYDIDSLPIPNRKFIDTKSYEYRLFGELATNIQTQRGCPFQCKFCCGRNIDIYRKVRNHSPERVIQELDQLNKEFGYTHFMWYDDEINVNPEKLIKLCDELKKRPYKHRGFIRSDLVVKYPETIKHLKEAGFVKLCAGVESGSDKILKEINKLTTYDINLKACQIVKEHGIHFESFLIMGHPTETKEDVELTIKWIKEAKPDDFDINILTPYPGSVIYDYSIPSKKYKGFKWEYNGLYFNKVDYSKEESYYKGHKGGSATKSRTDDMTYDYLFNKREEIQKLR